MTDGFSSPTSGSNTSFFAGAVNTSNYNCLFTSVGHDQHNTTHIYDTSRAAQEKELREKLKPAPQRGDSDVSPCMEGTREKIFDEIHKWLDNDDEPANILWIRGNPGSGKSAIAFTLESRLKDRHRPCSSFFFKRNLVDLNDPVAVWRTIACGLVDYSQFAVNLARVLEEDKVDPGRADINSHFQSFIRKTLTMAYHNENLPLTDTPVIIIDALDECASGEDSESDIKDKQRVAFLDTVANWNDLPKKFKLVVTSRDERFIPQKFRSTAKLMPLPTGSSVSAETNADMRYFLERRFTQVLQCSSLPEWLEKDLDTLTRRAAGLFIWAETVVKFVGRGLPIKNRENLALVLRGNMGERKGVAKLYEQILDFSFPQADDQSVVKPIVSAVVLAKVPLRVNDVAEIVSHIEQSEKTSSDTVQHIVDKLSSVISIGRTDQFLRVGHLSFTEFLCDSKPDTKWFGIDRSRESQKLAMSCFRLMSNKLKFNICDLPSSYLSNDNVEGLSHLIEKNISSALFYSCRFWAAHVLDTTIEPHGHSHESLMKEIEEFLYTRVLFWLEVMSLKKEVTSANVALLVVSPRIRVSGALYCRCTSCLKLSQEDLAVFCQDTSRFVVNFEIPISISTPHIYVSALPWAPQESLVAKCYRSRFPRTLEVISGGDQKWPPMINIFRGHTNWVRSITFSPDGKWVVSGSADKTIRIWDASSGDVAAGPFEGHSDSVFAVAFSPDNKLIASGSRDNTVRIWNVGTPQSIPDPFEGHTDSVFSVSFSPDGKRVASASADNTVRIWDIKSKQVIADVFRGHTNWVYCVTFSPDGKQIASGSADNTVRIWDAGTGEGTAILSKGHTDSVFFVAFSPDNKRIASGSADQTIRIWDAEYGGVIAGPFNGHSDWVNSISFSPDGNSVASGSDDNTIHIRNAETGKLIAGPFKGHTKSVASVAFSPDGKYVASGSGDNTIRIWDAGSSRAVAAPSDDITGAPVPLSLREKQMVSGSFDTGNATIRFWDVKNCQIGSPVRRHADVVVSISPSIDGQKEASGSHITLRMWDAERDKVFASRFVGEVGVVDLRRDTGGWATCSDLADCDPSDSRHLFWVPETCREAMCGIEILAVFNKHTTRLDLSRFEHGTSWTQCYDHTSDPPYQSHSGSSTGIRLQSVQCTVHADEPIPPCSPLSVECSCAESDDRPTLSGVTPPSLPMSAVGHCIGSVKQASDSPPPVSDQSFSSYARRFPHVAIILIPLITIYYFRAISNSK